MSSASSDDKNIKEQQPKVINIRMFLISDNRSLSSMSVHGESITTVSPDGEHIPRKKGKKKLSEIPIAGNKITQDLDNQSKKSKVVSSIDGEKSM